MMTDCLNPLARNPLAKNVPDGFLYRFRFDVSRYGEALDNWRIPGKYLNHKDTKHTKNISPCVFFAFSAPFFCFLRLNMLASLTDDWCSVRCAGLRLHGLTELHKKQVICGVFLRSSNPKPVLVCHSE